MIDNFRCPIVTIKRIQFCRYFVCFQQQKIERQCSPGLYWDVRNNWCTFADQDLQCDTRTTNDPNNPTSTTEVVASSTIETVTSTETTTLDPNVFECSISNEVTLHPHPLVCEKYFMCFLGISYLRSCADGFVFDIIQSNCFPREESICIIDLLESHPWHNDFPAVIDPEPFNCPINVKLEVTLHPNPKQCTRYYLCLKGIAYTRECARGLIFDVDQLKCFREDQARCILDDKLLKHFKKNVFSS